MWRQDGAWQSSQQTPTLTQTAQRPTPAIPSQTHTIRPPARGGGASTGALALRIQGGAVTTVASFAQLGVPTPDTASQPLVAGQPPWKPQLPELEPVVTSSKLAALASMSGLREPRVDLPACSRSSLSKPDDGRGGAAAAVTAAPGSPQHPVAAAAAPAVEAAAAAAALPLLRSAAAAAPAPAAAAV